VPDQAQAKSPRYRSRQLQDTPTKLRNKRLDSMNLEVIWAQVFGLLNFSVGHFQITPKYLINGSRQYFGNDRIFLGANEHKVHVKYINSGASGHLFFG
jgi:hypothetical protein